MYAVILSGGKQHRVSVGQTVKLEKLNAEEGATVDFDKVLLVSTGESVNVGKPYIDGSGVQGLVVEQGRHKKIKILKFRRRKHHMKHQGHRQDYTAVKITGIRVA